MPKQQVIQFVNKTKAPPKKKASGFIRLSSVAPQAQEAQENPLNNIGQEVRAVFDPPPEFAVRDHGNVGLKQKIVEIVKEKIAKQAAPAIQNDEDDPVSAPFTWKATKPKGKMCVCGRFVKNCGPLLYQCCKCGQTFCSSYVGRNQAGVNVHVKHNSHSECGPVILIRKNSVSQIKIKTS